MLVSSMLHLLKGTFRFGEPGYHFAFLLNTEPAYRRYIFLTLLRNSETLNAA